MDNEELTSEEFVNEKSASNQKERKIGIEDKMIKDLHRTSHKLDLHQRKRLAKLLMFFYKENPDFLYTQVTTMIASFFICLEDISIDIAYQGFNMIIEQRDAEYQNLPQEVSYDLASILYVLEEKQKYYKHIFKDFDVFLPSTGFGLMYSFLIGQIGKHSYTLVILYTLSYITNKVPKEENCLKSTCSYEVIFAAVIALFDIAVDKNLKPLDNTLDFFLKYFKSSISPLDFQREFFSIGKRQTEEVVSIRNQIRIEKDTDIKFDSLLTNCCLTGLIKVIRIIRSLTDSPAIKKMNHNVSNPLEDLIPIKELNSRIIQLIEQYSQNQSSIYADNLEHIINETVINDAAIEKQQGRENHEEQDTDSEQYSNPENHEEQDTDSEQYSNPEIQQKGVKKSKFISIFLMVIGFIIVTIIDVLNLINVDHILQSQLYPCLPYVLLSLGCLLYFIGFSMLIYAWRISVNRKKIPVFYY